jgi:integrase
MRQRDRRSANGLLPLMEARPWKDGKTVTYRYHPIGGKPINLGTDKAAAIRKVLDMNGRGDEFGTLAWVWEKYQESPRWARLADGTRADYRLCAKELLRVFGSMPISAITAPMVARYVRIERRDAPTRANREKSLLSNLFAQGVDLGVCEGNPAKAVRPNVEEPRTQAVEADVLEAFAGWLAQQSPQRRVIALMARYAALSGSRRAEFLDLTWPQVDRQAGVVRTKRAKQHGKKRGEVIELVEITDRLGQDVARRQRLPVRLPHSGRKRLHGPRLQGHVATRDGRGHQGTRNRARATIHLPRPARALRHRAQARERCVARPAQEPRDHRTGL